MLMFLKDLNPWKGQLHSFSELLYHLTKTLTVTVLKIESDIC